VLTLAWPLVQKFLQELMREAPRPPKLKLARFSHTRKIFLHFQTGFDVSYGRSGPSTKRMNSTKMCRRQTGCSRATVAAA
jgi:hypothetical protein